MARHLRPDRKKQRQESAAARQAAFDAMTPEKKRAHLLARDCPPVANEWLKIAGGRKQVA